MNVAGTKAVVGKNAASMAETWQWPQSDLLVLTFITVMLLQEKKAMQFLLNVLDEAEQMMCY